MIAYGKRAHGLARRRPLDLGTEAPYYKGEWMESGQDPGLSPTIFLVEQPPGSVLPTHFHRQNEFQVVLGGDGRIGQHALRPVSVHYAGAYTGYGPVVAGPSGLSYFTIRPVFDTGAILAAQAREQMVRGPKRQLHALPYDPPTLGADMPSRCDVIMAEADDGLYCAAHALRAAQPLTSKFRPDGGGSFYLVLAGQLNTPSEALCEWESVYFSADEAACSMSAGPAGAVVLEMQSPATAEAYRPKTGVGA